MEDSNLHYADILQIRDIASTKATRALACSIVGGMVFWAVTIVLVL